MVGYFGIWDGHVRWPGRIGDKKQRSDIGTKQRFASAVTFRESNIVFSGSPNYQRLYPSPTLSPPAVQLHLSHASKRQEQDAGTDTLILG